MFEDWGLPVLKQNTSKKTGKTTDSTDKEVLHELSFIDPRAKYLRQYREALGNKTKFVDAPEASAEYNGDGKSHPLAIVFSTYTGRVTYVSKQGKNKDERQIGFALHQEKREERFRDIAIPPEGYTLVEFDAAGQEYRWMAIASGDPAMQHLCMEGEDAHTYMGAQIARRDYTELRAAYAAKDKDAGSARQLGKVANLSCGYRTSAGKLRVVARVNYSLPMELPEATHIRETYLRTYPNVPRYWSRQIEQVKRLGYAETFAGRRVQVQGSWSGDGAWSREATAINYPIQGTGADQKYLALAVLRGYIVKHGIHFAWELHDGLYFYVPTKIVDKVIPEMRYLLNNLPYKKAWGFDPPIPLPWDCKASDKSWGQLKEVKV
jgi:DNA polymerase-1